jgi:hypothetical protein
MSCIVRVCHKHPANQRVNLEGSLRGIFRGAPIQPSFVADSHDARHDATSSTQPKIRNQRFNTPAQISARAVEKIVVHLKKSKAEVAVFHASKTDMPARGSGPNCHRKPISDIHVQRRPYCVASSYRGLCWTCIPKPAVTILEAHHEDQTKSDHATAA